MGPLPVIGWHACLPSHADLGQLEDVVIGYVRSHPALGAVGLVGGVIGGVPLPAAVADRGLSLSDALLLTIISSSARSDLQRRDGADPKLTPPPVPDCHFASPPHHRAHD
jgi:hypothetical protein